MHKWDFQMNIPCLFAASTGCKGVRSSLTALAAAWWTQRLSFTLCEEAMSERLVRIY
jgi:hypothetical protein